MDFKDKLKGLGERIARLKTSVLTEEATKTSFVMPFLQILGYDVFDPFEVVPEMVCDIGTKKGEKIDYCIQREGEPIILIECKHWGQNLTLHDNQLLRYFHVSKAKFGVLTNGIIYRFYSDLNTPNKMDETPFLEVDITELKEVQVEELKKFHKSYFDIETILDSAGELKYMGELKKLIAEEFNAPSDELVKYLGKQICDKAFTQKVLEQFTPLVRRAIREHISDTISQRLSAAMQPQAIATEEVTDVEMVAEPSNGIVTTEEEKEAYYIVRSMLAPHVDPKRVFWRDAVNYFTIILDDNNRKNICRLYLNSPTSKRLVIQQEDKEELRLPLSDLTELYKHAEVLIASAMRFV